MTSAHLGEIPNFLASSMLWFCFLLQAQLVFWSHREIKFEEALPPIGKAQMQVIMQETFTG
jgi:hypothetical protein